MIFQTNDQKLFERGRISCLLCPPWISWANVHYHSGYLGQMCVLMVDILGKCAFSWWISWANVRSHGGYLGQMCILIVDILGKCASIIIVDIIIY